VRIRRDMLSAGRGGLDASNCGSSSSFMKKRDSFSVPGPLPLPTKGVTAQSHSPFQFFPTNRIIDLVKTLEDIKSTLSQHRKDISENFRVRDMGVFGSFVRGEAKEGSDVDIIVTFSAPIGLFKFMSLEEYLEGLLGLKVDLVSKDALKPRIGARILKEVVYV